MVNRLRRYLMIASVPNCTRTRVRWATPRLLSYANDILADTSQWISGDADAFDFLIQGELRWQTRRGTVTVLPFRRDGHLLGEIVVGHIEPFQVGQERDLLGQNLDLIASNIQCD